MSAETRSRWKLFRRRDRSENNASQPRASTTTPPEPLPFGLKVEKEGQDPTVDIIIVHGLNGHREKTWTASNGVHWPRDLLSGDLPNARILSWGYDASTHGDQVSCMYLYDHARQLVTDLCLERNLTQTSTRPIIFVAHSLGGIVVKSALIHADAARAGALKEHRSIKTSTYGIIFMGTPHQGGSGVQLGKLLVNVASVFVAANTRLLQVLERDSAWLQQQLGQYGPISGDFVTKFAFEVYETRTMLGHSLMVVPRASAVVPGVADAEPIAIHADHINMVKFASKEDSGYKTVAGQLRLMARDASDTVSARWKVERRVDVARLNLKDPEEQKTGLEQLRVVEDALFDSYGQVHTSCHPDTRRELLDQIYAWTQRSNAPSIFWLNGMAGTGKSTISRTVAEQLATADHSTTAALGASFFFKRGEGDRGSAALLFPTIVEQLATRIDGFRKLVVQAIRNDPRICSKALGEQFKRLLDEPIRKLTRPTTHQHYIVVVDALDECEKEEDMRTILQLWSTWSTTGNVRLRLFVTSRPEVPIRLGFREMSGGHQVLILHEVPQPILQHDILVFLQDAFAEIRKDYNREPLGDALDDHWPGEDTLRTLTDMAVPLFIVAATIFRYILGNPRPERRLQEVLTNYESGHRSAMASGYRLVLKVMEANIQKEEINATYQIFRRVVGSIVSLAEPLSPSALADLLAVSLEDVNICLRPLHAVLQVPTDSDSLVRPLHLSFGEYLTSTAAKTEPFSVHKEETHDMLWKRCLHVLVRADGLHENLCGLSSPGHLRSEVSPKLLKRRFPLALRYACEYWVYHLRMSPSMLRDNEEVHAFLQTHFLHWLEALSLLDRLARAIGFISILRSKLVQGVQSSHVSQLLADAGRYILANRFVGELAPLQLYSSAIIFAPQNSIVRNTCGRIPDWISLSPKTKAGWGPEVQKLEGHTYWVSAVDFSPDGSRLASASGDQTVRVWDAGTGAEVQKLEGHTSSVSAVAFSPDGLWLASASWDQTVRVWDAGTGAEVQKLEGHAAWVMAVSFSPDGSRLASASLDQTVRVWDTSTGAEVQKLEGHTAWVTAISFSPDGSRLASASEDRTVRVWNAGTGAEVQKLEGHTSSVGAVAFSPDGSRLASASWDQTVRVWDAGAGAEVQTLEGHTNRVNTVMFSPNGLWLASASNDQTVRVWDAGTGAEVQKLEGHTDWVTAVAFSPDASRLASASNDQTVRLWDAGTGAEVQKLVGHTASVTAMSFSPDGSRLASVSYDYTVRVWNTSTGVVEQTLKGHSNWVTMVAFSPDGSRLASASDDRTVRVWDAGTGAEVQKLEGHRAPRISAVAFSPDGSRLASASEDRTVRVWDAGTGAEVQKLEGHTSSVRAVAFSPDGSRLASASHDQTVRVWDAGTGAEVQRLELAGVTWLRFTDSGCLTTNRGSINLYPQNAAQTLRGPVLIDSWVVFYGRRVLWLPHEYRSNVTTIVNELIAIGTGAGAVVFIRLDPSRLSSSIHKILETKIN